MVEKDFQAQFNTWLALNPPGGTTAYELKICKGKSIGFDHVAEHQIKALRAVKKRGLYHKISDAPFGHSEGFRFHKPKPFDCFWIKGEAFVVVLFYEPRRSKVMCFIDVDVWVKERDGSDRKSLTLDRAREISHLVRAL